MKKSLTAVVSGIAGVAVFAGVVIAASTIHIPNGSDPKPTPAIVVVDYRAFDATPTHPAPAVLAAPVVEAPAPVEEAPAEPSGPDLCPSGTQANSSDGYNDTSCFPVICFGITLPDPTHPECDYAYPPEYYR